MTGQIENLKAEYAAAKSASDAAYREMWANKADKTLVDKFSKLFKAKGDARRALEAAQGEKLNPLYETDAFAVAKTLEGDKRDDNSED